MTGPVGPLEAAAYRHPALLAGLREWTPRLLLAVLAANLVTLLWYIWSGYRAHFHSDAATKNLIAGEIFATGRFFPPDFNHVNFDLWIWFGHVVIVPLLAFFPNGYALHAFSGTMSAALLLVGTWAVASLLTPSRTARLACLAVVSAGLSDVMADNLYGQVSYGTIFYLTCFHVYAAWRSLRGPRPGAWLAGFAVLVLLMYWANPQRATVSYGLPLAMALATHGFVAWGEADMRADLRRALVVFGVLAAGSILGTALHLWTLKGLSVIGGTGTALWLHFDHMLRNVSNTAQGLLAMLGGLPPPGGALVQRWGPYQALRLVAAASMLFLIPWGLRLALARREPAVRFVAAFTLALGAAVLFVQLTTSVPDMSDPVQSTRYVVPPLLLAMLVVITHVAFEPTAWVRRAAAVATVAVLATSAYASLVKPLPATSHAERLAAFLRKEGLEYGYGGYWNAGVVTVLTAGATSVRQVIFTDGLPAPYRHLSSNRWYRPDAWRGRTFLLVPAGDKSLDRARLAQLAGEPERTLEFEGMQVLVYPRNLAEALPGWAR